MSKLQAFADNKLNVTYKSIKFVFHWVEKVVRKGDDTV